MIKNSRYNYICGKAAKRIFAAFLVLLLVTGCGLTDGRGRSSGKRDETATDSHVDFEKLKKENEDIFAWLYVPDTAIDCPVVQNADGDDSFYLTHNEYGETDPKGAVYIEAANMRNMCDFNEVLHVPSASEDPRFQDLSKFLDRSFFDDHEYIYVYTEGNALIYYIFAAYVREDERLISQYDFSYAQGCQDFLDEIFLPRTMNRNIRDEWAGELAPENFLITLTTQNADDPGLQTVVIGCLVGDVRGEIDRYVDYSDPDGV
ncbi:MAG: class B sortase [Butyrivibrio sp.]|nr:class B sortase [Butyrivibrio sp.]